MKRTALALLLALPGALVLGGRVCAQPAGAISAPTPMPLPSFRPASTPTSMPYPAYGTPAPGVQSTAVVPGVPQVITLEEAIRIGFARSPLLALARADVALARAGVRIQQAGLFPLVTGTASTERLIGKANALVTGGSLVNPTTFATNVTTNALSVDLQQLIFDGGKLFAEIRAAQRGESAQIDTYRRDSETVAFNVAQAYYASLAAQRTTAVDVEVVRQDLVQRDLVAAQVRAGTAARSDIATVELPVAQARLALVQAQGAELSAQAAFANAMGLSADVNVLPFDDTPIFTRAAIATVPIPTYERAIVRAEELRPDYDAAKQTIASFQAAVTAAERGYSPVLSGTADTGTFSTNVQGGAYRPSTTLGLQLSVPIFDQGLTQADIAQAKANLAGAQAQFLTTEQGIELNVKQALANFVSAKAAVDQANEEYATALTVFQATSAQYQAGVTTLPLLLNAEVGLTTALASQVQTVYALRQAEQAFLYAEGDNIR